MGNLCGKEESTSSAPAGRVLGSAPTLSTNVPVSTAAYPKAKNSKKPKVTGPGRTLGASSPGSIGGITDGDQPQSQSSPGAAAARAAEQRLNNTQKTGKLAAQLDQDKRKTQNQRIQDLAKTKGQEERLVWD